jgi:hypothetical protein
MWVLADKAWMTRIARGLAAGVAIALLSVLAPTASAVEAPSAVQVPGLSAHLMWSGLSAAERDHQFALLASAGARITRVDVGWSSLEQSAKGAYEEWYLDRLDGVVYSAEQYGIDLLLTFTDSPCWASSAPELLKQGCTDGWWDRGVQRYPPVNAQDYADALAFLVRRYGDRVAGWEIWNEPNIDFYFKSADQPADYARIVRAAYPAAKAADPSTTVIAGSLAESPAPFVEALFEHGIGGHFDAFSLHPYSGDASPLDPLEDFWIKNSFVRGVPSVRNVLLRHGEDKPIWLTEFGWHTATIRDVTTWKNGVGEETQARYIEQSLLQVKQWPYVPVAIIYELQDESADRADRNSNFGLLRYDGTFKPAFEAFHRGALALSDPRPPQSLDPDGPRRLRAWLERHERRVYARGVGEPRSVARVRVYRYLRSKRRFARRATYAAKVKVRASGRFKRRLDSRFAHGRWRVKAKYARSV